MNIYNNNTIKELASFGISTVTLSPELDKETLNSFNSIIKTEAIIYGNLPVMTTNYCLLSGSNYCLEKCKANCGNSNQTYYLKDRMNMEFKVSPDSFTKTTTIYNSKKTSISINEINTDFARLDFNNENIDEIISIINTFKNGEILEGKEYTNGNFKRIV
jgi:putative protease